MNKKTNKIICVDSSILLAEIFNNETQNSRVGAIDEIQKYFSFEKYIAKTVKKEIKSRISSMIKTIEDLSKQFIDEFKIFKNKMKTIKLDDLSFFEIFFSEIKKNHKVRSTELEIINNMESTLARYLVENYNKDKLQKTDDFILNTMIEFRKLITKIDYDLQIKISECKIISESVNPSTCKKLHNEPRLKKIVKKKSNDIQILCEIEAYQKKSYKKCLLLTIDQNDLLNNKQIIESLIGVKCVDPIYLPKEF